jgi:hypothetical protein
MIILRVEVGTAAGYRLKGRSKEKGVV